MSLYYLGIALNLPLGDLYSYSCEAEEPPLPGVRVIVSFRNRKLTGWVVEVSEDKPDFKGTLKEVERVVDTQPLCDKTLFKLAAWMKDYYFCSLGEVLACMLPGGKREKDLSPLGFEQNPEVEKKLTLSDEQESAVNDFQKHSEDTHYLYGMTGSGKTEVFLRICEFILSLGKSVIYLVPEITLTHQVLDSFKKRFSSGIAVLHSHLTPSQKLKEWRKIQSGEAQLIIGARSAVFAPLKNLGLIIIDEEHENTYKSGSHPRYHARQVAMMRCRMEKSGLIMGSATPSAEAWKMMQDGQCRRHELTRRLAGGQLPEIVIVDLKKEKSILSRKLVETVEETLQRKKQVILFLNRRGFAYFFHCKNCDFEMTCKNCSVPLTYHKAKGQLVCHYCGHRERPVQICPKCGSSDTGYSGFGTEQVEEEIKRVFAPYSIARVDGDSVSKKGALQEVLSRFASGEIQILLGTQMVAKGLNFKDVELVGLIQADSGLHLPDFRASERTFALLVQVSGRAGRFSDQGKVILQTYQPKDPAIVYGAANRMEEFYERELKQRKMLGFPPYQRLMRLVFRGKDQNLVRSEARRFKALLIESPNEYLGPEECPLSMISGNYRFHIIGRADTQKILQFDIKKALELFKKNSRVYMEIDPDPVNLL